MGGMGVRRWCLSTVAVLVGTGCAARPAPSASEPAALAVTRADLPLEAIGPAPHLPAGPTTRPHGRPSLDALVAYAAGRDALARDDAVPASVDFRRSVDLDPGRFEPQFDLGRALAAGHAGDALAELARAADLAPDSVEAQTAVGRVALATRQTDVAVGRLRLAMQTTGYHADAGRAATVDLLLARALAADGYDRAALDRYAVLIARFHDPTLSLDNRPELTDAIEHPAELFVPIGRLLDRRGDYASALAAFGAAGDDDRFDLAWAMAADEARLGRADAALRRAVAQVVRDAASPPSLRLLADVCRLLGRPDDLDPLRALSGDRPDDVPVRLALADALVAGGRPAEAAGRLRAGLQRSPGDVRLARRYALASGRAATVRVLDAARAAAAGDAARLYPLAGSYAAVGEPGAAAGVLERVLSLDPHHAAASNDLGFALADAGRDLDRAERLVRVAVAAGPDDPAYVGSLGWVLYKRGRFADARPLLERAAAAADPVALDHLGDDLYRLSRPADATAAWQRALSALPAAGDDARPLRLQLQTKVGQAAAGHPIDVAPLASQADNNAKSRLTTDN